MLKVFVGWDPREAAAYQVCVRSLVTRSSVRLEVQPLVLSHLRALGLYRRAHEWRDGVLWDSISDAPMATEFALSRFLVPCLAGWGGWVLYCDSDFLWRADVAELLALSAPRHAVMVVQHRHRPGETVKMTGQAQLRYPRKNWSSLMLWNCSHRDNRALTPAVVGAWPGRSLHGFAWLDDHRIGALPEAWNWLEGWSDPPSPEGFGGHARHSPDGIGGHARHSPEGDGGPKAVHYTRGTPDMAGREDAAYAEEWRAVLQEIEGPVPQSPALHGAA
jgi:hypothetical protein